jgi:adenine-specific DNA-methyltransferase
MCIVARFLRHGDVEAFLDGLPAEPIFDLAFTSPQYNVGKGYAEYQALEDYLVWQRRMMGKIIQRLTGRGDRW